jgi:murein DD-endopeptidase MepM/ murein hydrolase activator NlpD
LRDKSSFTVTLILIPVVAVWFISCGSHSTSDIPSSPAQRTLAVTTSRFDEYLKTDFPSADGFDFAVGDRDGKGPYEDIATGKRYSGWYVATHFGENYSYGIHTGEDWSGTGPPASDLGQDVHSVANGKVIFADFCGRLWGNVVMIDHIFYENNEKKIIRSVYAHLHEIKTRAGDIVTKRQVIASVGQDPEKLFAPHLHLELRWDQSLAPTYWPSSNGKDVAWMKDHYAEPTRFINDHRTTPVPSREPTLMLIDQATYRLRLVRNGQSVGEYDVSLGQGHGAKQIEGDNKTPVGMYFVIQKHSGSFEGPYGAYYGGYWIKVNYPNKFDGARAEAEKLITAKQLGEISTRWRQRQPTLENTKLGGGIGFHGWIREWSNDGPRHLSWGCVVMHIYDISKLYDQVPEGTMVVIF